MQRVKVHELRKLTEADLVERLTKERVSISVMARWASCFGIGSKFAVLIWFGCLERASATPRQQGFLAASG